MHNKVFEMNALRWQYKNLCLINFLKVYHERQIFCSEIRTSRILELNLNF